MLKKLLKHEIRATAKIFMWLYIAFAVIVAVNVLLGPFSSAVMSANAANGAAHDAGTTIQGLSSGFFMTLYVLSVIAISIVTFVVVILRFYRNLLGDEGYLMMTLPVSRDQHILSKLLVAVAWTICTTVLIFLSILLFIGVAGAMGDVSEGLRLLASSGAPLGRWIFFGVLSLLAGCFYGVLMLYAAMAIGPNLLKNRLGGSILAYIIIYVASQIVMFVVVVGISLSSFSYGGGGIGFSVSSEFAASSGEAPTAGLSMSQSDITGIDAVCALCIIGSAILGLCCWFLTSWMLKRKLNLA